MSTLISYQKAYFTNKGKVVSREPCNLTVPGNRPHRTGNLRYRRFPQPSLLIMYLFLKGLRFITPKAFSELLKLSREYQMLTKVTNFWWTQSQRVFQCVRQMLKQEHDGKELIERIDKRITVLSYHIQKDYWRNFTQLNKLYR
ncbi:hypothetical protein RYX36_035173 [Vicia faba]